MKSNLVLIAAIVFGFAAIFGLSRFLDARDAPLPPEIVEADLAFQSSILKRYSFGFEGLMADYYWMSALNYIGTKIVAGGGLSGIRIDDLTSLNPRLLYPMLDTATTLDPEFADVYIYGAIILPSINLDDAIKLGEKGVAEQSENWQVYHQLGYLYWRNENYQRAAEVYALGAAKPNAPEWMFTMSAKMRADGSDPQIARQIYDQMLASAPTEHAKTIAEANLLRLDSLAEREAIKTVLQKFQNEKNRCPSGWREISQQLNAAKTANGDKLRLNTNAAPLDPSGAAYLLETDCAVKLDAVNSQIIPDPIKK